MTENSARRAPSAGTQMDVAEIQLRVISFIAAALMATGGVASWHLLPGPGFKSGPFVVAFSLFAQGALVFALRARRPGAAHLILLVGPSISLALALWLLSSGRCISANHEGMAGSRVMGTCVAIDQAAGTAAALAVRGGVAPAKVSVPELRRLLREDGALV